MSEEVLQPKFDERIADKHTILEVIHAGLFVEEYDGEKDKKIGEIERIVFKNARIAFSYVPGVIEFYSGKRRFYIARGSTLYNTFQFVKDFEEGNRKREKSPLKYSVSVSAHELRRIYSKAVPFCKALMIYNPNQ